MCLTYARLQRRQLMINAVKPNQKWEVVNLSKRSIPTRITSSWKSCKLYLKLDSQRFLYPWAPLPLGDPGNECLHVPPPVTSCKQTITQLPVVCLSCRNPITSQEKGRWKERGAWAAPVTENSIPLCWIGQQAEVQRLTCAPNGQLLREYWRRYFGNVMHWHY